MKLDVLSIIWFHINMIQQESSRRHDRKRARSMVTIYVYTYTFEYEVPHDTVLFIGLPGNLD